MYLLLKLREYLVVGCAVTALFICMWAAYSLTQDTSVQVSIEPEVNEEDTVVETVLFTPSNTFLSGNILYVGDIMLARRVETYMRMYGPQFPFASSTAILHSFDSVVGNFEGTIPLVHTQTPELTFRFSVMEAYMDTLLNAGFDTLSLANNHAFDFGEEAYQHTLARCRVSGMVCAGHPYEVSTSSVTFQEIGSTTLGTLFLHATTEVPPISVLQTYITYACHESDVCVVYVHWGTEYSLNHSAFQEDLAHILIDMGVDAVVGHHPHVVQDIGHYKGKPIFYSLGNFVFDQFFEYEVQVGLGVSLEIKEDELFYTLIPFSSLESRSQPEVAPVSIQLPLLARVLLPIKDVFGVNATTGTIRVSRTE